VRAQLAMLLVALLEQAAPAALGSSAGCQGQQGLQESKQAGALLPGMLFKS
jgi:hypothetical protein